MKPRSNESGVLSRYLREIRSFPLLSGEDEQRLLARLIAGDADARTRLVQGNLGFVVKIAGEYRALGLPFEDLLNEGNLGLIEAAERYDPSRGTRFTTYAIWWVRKRILSAIADRSLVVRVPAGQRRKIFELRKAETELRAQLGRRPTRGELARHLKVPLRYVENLLNRGMSQSSLDHAADGGAACAPKDLLPDETPSAEDALMREEAALLVERAFRDLDKREQAVLGWRFGLDGQATLTLREIGQRMSISRERVRQIENEARARMRRWLQRRHRWKGRNETR